MATLEAQQPLVCASLHLPPDPQPFLRIHEVTLYTFLPNFERLRDDLKATPDIDPEVTESFFETLRVLTLELHTVFKVLQLAQEIAERYRKVLEALQEKKPTEEALFEVYLGAGAGILYTKEGQKAMSTFRREFEKAVERVRTTAGAKDERGRKSLTSAKNIQAVSEILTATNECDGLIQRCEDQFEELKKQTRNKDSIDSDPPSEEETQVIRAKWQTFFDKVDGVWRQGFEIATEISMPPLDGPRYISENPKPRQKVPLWRALFQREDKQDSVRSGNLLEMQRTPTDPNATVVTPGGSHEITANVINPLDTTPRSQAPEDTAAPDTTPSNGQPVNRAKVSFWEKTFRRTNSSSPRDASGVVEASDEAPDATAPPPKVTFWRKFFRWATRVSTKSFR